MNNVATEAGKIVYSLIMVSPCSNTGQIRDNPSQTSRKNSLELMELSSIINN